MRSASKRKSLAVATADAADSFGDRECGGHDRSTRVDDCGFVGVVEVERTRHRAVHDRRVTHGDTPTVDEDARFGATAFRSVVAGELLEGRLARARQ